MYQVAATKLSSIIKSKTVSADYLWTTVVRAIIVLFQDCEESFGHSEDQISHSLRSMLHIFRSQTRYSTDALQLHDVQFAIVRCLSM